MAGYVLLYILFLLIIWLSKNWLFVIIIGVTGEIWIIIMASPSSSHLMELNIIPCSWLGEMRSWETTMHGTEISSSSKTRSLVLKGDDHINQSIKSSSPCHATCHALVFEYIWGPLFFCRSHLSWMAHRSTYIHYIVLQYIKWPSACCWHWRKGSFYGGAEDALDARR